jgi:oligopeptide transport system substrate-binding protein
MDLQKTITESLRSPLPSTGEGQPSPLDLPSSYIDDHNAREEYPLPSSNRKNMHRIAKKDIHISFPTSVSEAVATECCELVETMVQGGLQQLGDSIPIVFCPPQPEEKQSFKICCLIESTPEALLCSPDLLSFSLPQDLFLSSSTIFRVLFSIDTLQGRSFLFIYNAATFEGHDARHILTKFSSHLPQQIALCLTTPALCQHIATALATTPHTYTPLLQQELMRWISPRFSFSPTVFLNELQRFLLAVDTDFKTIRTPTHLLRLVHSHLWLKEKHSYYKSLHGSEKWFYYRVFRSKLQFPFGTKDVICLVISLHSLSTYEQFDHRHILLACKRCIPSLEAVPRSFYMYRYSEEPTLSLYLEIEKNDGSPPSSNEMTLLKRELGQELSASIEQVMSRIDIPQNEEDLLRNFLLLSQQIRTIQDTPQVIIQFHGQSDTALEFHVTLVRVIKRGQEEAPIPSVSVSEITRCVPLRSSVIDTLRAKHIKQGIVFLVECLKEHFLRRDRSVDFLKARESVVHCIESSFGKVRDLNGGLIYQQHQLLKNIHPLLTKEETKEISLIENLFHSLSPSIMKNLLGPEHVVTVFRQLLALRKRAHHASSNNFIVEEYSKEVFIGFIRPPSFTKEDVFQAEQLFQLTNNELAVCEVLSDGHQFCFVICLSQDMTVREKITTWLQEKIREKRVPKEKKSLRICLSRPILSLDPRIGTDRISGTVIKMLYEGLMRLDPSGSPSHAIAEEVLISDDGKTYTFMLRPTYWTNGSQVTAYDFEYAWKKILDPSFQTVFDYLFFPIFNARLAKAGRLSIDAVGIHAINDHVLIVELERPSPYFLELCCLWIYSPLCQDLDKNHPGWAYFGDRTYVCNGPFKLIKWGRNSGIQVEKNEHYWDKERVSVEHIDLKLVEDPLAALQLFEQGDLDWIGEPLSETPLCLFKQRNPRIHTYPMAAVQWYDFNVQHPPFRSTKVRQAFSYALDRTAIIREILYGDERPSHSILPPSLSLIDSQPPLAFDLEIAHRLFRDGMEEQGLTDSILKPLKMVVYDKEPHKTMAQAVIHAWEKAFGISIVLDVVSWHEFFERVGGTSHDILGHVWYSWYKDPLYTLGVFKSKNNSMNSSHWSNEEYTQLIDKAEAEIDSHQRELLLKKAEGMILHEVPCVPVFDYNSRYLKNENVDNIYVSHLGNVDFKWASFSPHHSASLKIPSHDVVASSHPSTDKIRLYLQTEPLSLDPRVGGDKRNQVLIRELYEGLMRIGKDGRCENGLAESISISDDLKVYVFHLRPSLWSNGSELTADDFVWTIKSAIDPSFSTSYAYAFFPIKNAKKAHHGECSFDDVGIAAKDKKTLEITLERPVPYFLELTSNPIYSPVCKACVSGNHRWASDVFPKYTCNGPFILSHHSQKSEILLEKNPYYWDSDSVKSSRLSFRIIKDPQEAFQMFELGELDWYGDPCGTITPESFRALHRKGSLKHRQGGGTAWLACRTDIPHLKSPKIRRAIACAINRQELCESLYHTPAFSLLPPFMTLADTKAFEDNSPETAVALFEEGLAEIGMAKEGYPSLAISHVSDPTINAAVKTVQKQLKGVLGIHVTTSLQDWDIFVKRFSAGDFEMALASWFAWFEDPIFTLQLLKYKNTGMNGTAWEDPTYSRLLDLSDSARDAQQRREYLKQAEALVMNELPVIPIFYRADSYAKAPGVVGEVASPVGLMELKHLKRTHPGGNFPQ